MILCDLRVGNIHPWVIHINRGPILHHIFVGGGHYTAAGCGIVGVGPRKTHFYPQKYNFGRNRHDGIFQKSQRQHTAPPMELFRSRY